MEKHKDSRSEELLETSVTEDSGELIENERADMVADPSPRQQPSEEEIGESLSEFRNQMLLFSVKALKFEALKEF